MLVTVTLVTSIPFRRHTVCSAHDIFCDQEGGRLVMRNVGRGLLELNVARLAAADASNYSCSAVNDVGRSQRAAVLTVHCKLSSRAELPSHSFLSIHRGDCGASREGDKGANIRLGLCRPPSFYQPLLTVIQIEQCVQCVCLGNSF